MSWHYALARELLPDGEERYTVREVYVGKDGALSWTDPITPSGETRQDVVDDLALMWNAAGRPTLDLTLDPPALVGDAEVSG